VDTNKPEEISEDQILDLDDLDTDEESTVSVKENNPIISIKNTLKALAQAVSNGNISSHQAKQFRKDLGIFQGHFTGKKDDSVKRKRIRKLAKKARNVTRSNGFKGQKMAKGKR